VKSNPKQPSCKKVYGPKKAIVKKDVKSKVVNNDNSDEFGAMWRRQPE